MSTKLRVAVLISGRGSNLAALTRAAKRPGFPAEIVVVVSNRPNAPGLEFVHTAGIPTAIVDHTDFGQNREAFEAALQAVLTSYDVQFICLAGFMRLLTSWFVSKWKNKILNIHPALLPAYKGLHTHERAYQDKARFHGASVHFVTAEMDSGPILARVPIHVRANDTPETLATRVLRIEHQIYPAALRLVGEGRVKIEDGYCYVDGKKINGRVLFYVSENKQVVFKGQNAFAFINMTRKQAAA